MADRLGFVGLGVMGAPMAGHLARAGHEVSVWNRTTSKAEALKGSGVNVATSIGHLAATCDIIFICVNRSEDVSEVVHSCLPTAKPGTLFVDHSTIAPAAAQQLAEELKEKGCGFVDAPITGGSMGAQKGQLTVFCGGSKDDVDRALPYIQAYAKRAERVGDSGRGQMMKLANQIAVGGALMACCETLSFAKKAGLDLALAKDMIGGGAGGSWAFDNYGPKVLARDWSPGFSVKNQRKDFAYCKEAAREVDAAIPGTVLVDDLLAQLDAEGHSEWTTAALYDVLLRMSDQA